MLLLLSPLCLATLLQADTLTVQAKGFASDKGEAAIAVYRDADAFPMKIEKSVAKVRVKIVGGEAKAEFANLPAGRYAVAVYHDANNNNKMDTNFLGIPKEATGASRNPKARMGPPKFADASFDFPTAEAIVIQIK